MAERPRKIRRLEEKAVARWKAYVGTKEEQELFKKNGIEQAKKLEILEEKRRQNRKSNEDEDKEKDTKPLKDSRLQLLNDDCLCTIFDLLNIVDLSRLSQLDVHFHELIQQRVIGKKLIDLNALSNLPNWLTERVLRQFGKHFRKVKAKTEYMYRDPLAPFEHFLETITKSCSPNTFTEVELDFFYSRVNNPDVERLSIPFFSNVHTLVMRDFIIEKKNVKFFLALANIVKNLKILTLDNVHLKCFDFSVFLQSKPKLQMFSYRSNDDISPMIRDTLKNCTNLKTYVHIQLKNPYSNFNTISDEMKNRYNYLREFVNLTSLTLTSHTTCGSDLCYPLQQLAAKNRLESLKVYFDMRSAIELTENERFFNAQQSFDHFTSLRNIDIKIVSQRLNTYDLKTNFLFHFMSKLKFLNRVRIIGQLIDNISQILEIVPNIRVLCVGHVTMKYLPVEMKKIVQSAMKVRKRQQQQLENTPLLHLNLNIQQWREVQVHKNIDSVFTSNVDKSICLGVRKYGR